MTMEMEGSWFISEDLCTSELLVLAQLTGQDQCCMTMRTASNVRGDIIVISEVA